MKYKLGDFKREGVPGSFQHYFSHTFANGDELCLEACLNGYCVAKYDKNKEIIGKKICTNLEGMLDMQIIPGFSIATGEALEKALKIVNTNF